jgi:hypothetical protein
MIQESEKYNKVLNILRKSKPELDSTESIEKEVIRRISGTQRQELLFSDVIDFIFGWVNIGWVRRSLIAVSLAMVVLFFRQQSIIMKRVDLLSKQNIVIRGEAQYTSADDVEKGLMMYKLSGRKFSSENITISEEQLNRLLESVNELKVQYKDLINMIEENPELKKYIENRLIENNRTKIKL